MVDVRQRSHGCHTMGIRLKCVSETKVDFFYASTSLQRRCYRLETKILRTLTNACSSLKIAAATGEFAGVSEDEMPVFKHSITDATLRINGIIIGSEVAAGVAVDGAWIWPSLS